MSRKHSASFPPLTPGMVADCARRPMKKLLRMQLAVAGFIAAAMLAVVFAQIRPALWRAIENLPEGARIQGSQLVWPGEKPVTLSQSETISIIVSGPHAGAAVPVSDWQFFVGEREMQIRSFLGYRSFPYLPDYRVELSRSAVEPVYGAWEAPAFVAIGVGCVLVLLVNWHLIGLFYGLVVKLLAWAFAKPLTYGKAYKVGLGALIPGAILMFAGIFGYALGQVDLPRLALIWVLHIVLGWVYLFLAVPKLATEVIENPFQPQSEAERPKKRSPFSGDVVEEEPKNPFAGSKKANTAPLNPPKKKPSAVNG